MFHKSKRNMQYVLCMTYCIFLFLSACGPTATPTYFIPPTAANILPTETAGIGFTTSTPLTLSVDVTPDLVEETPTPELPSPTPTCTNFLTFLEDVTVPDGSVLTAGEPFVKQWRVANGGDCDWDSGYTIKLVSGEALGAPTESVLYPARAGAEIVIEMNLVAPEEAGEYHTVWQAFNPEGIPFEQAIYVDFVVE